MSAVMTALITRGFLSQLRHVGGPQYVDAPGGQWRNEWLTARRLAHGDLLNGYLNTLCQIV